SPAVALVLTRCAAAETLRLISSPRGLRDARAQPQRDALEDRPGPLAKEVLVSRCVRVLSKGHGDGEADVLLERYERRRHADHLFAVERAARPGELQPRITVQSGLAACGGEWLVA